MKKSVHATSKVRCIFTSSTDRSNRTHVVFISRDDRAHDCRSVSW